MEIDYSQLDKRFRFYLDAIEIIKQDKIYTTGLINEYYQTDRLQILNEIDSFVKSYPERKKTYLKPLLKHYNLIQKVISENFGDDILHLHSLSIENEGYQSEKMNLISKIVYDTDFIIKHLKELINPEIQKQQETPLKYEKLKPIEKILIMYYLKIDRLTPYQMGLKPGNYFLSRLLDINPESIKNPLSKLPDYTTNDKLNESQARNLYSTLEKVKQFFDESELFKISKLVEERIKQLRFISGKD